MSVAPVAASATHRAHFAALDALRGIAALSVVVTHISWLSAAHFIGYARTSYLMVDVFFVLSGFVISYAYGDLLQRPAAVACYLWLRFWRIYPVHFTFLLVIAAEQGVKLLAVWLGAHANHPDLNHDGAVAFLCNPTLTQGLYVCGGESFNRPSWSISVEFFVYCLFALLAFSLRGRARSLVAGMVAAASIWFLSLSPTGIAAFTTDFGLLRCLAGFCLGTLAFKLYGVLREKAARHGRLTGYAALGSMLLFALTLQLGSHSRSDLLVYPLSFLMILLVALAPAKSGIGFLHSRPLQWLGAISYSLYIAHQAVLWPIRSVLQFVTHVHDRSGDVLPVPLALGNFAVIAALILVMAIGHLSYVAVERPWRDWSRRARTMAVVRS